jgi:hypothetical protein
MQLHLDGAYIDQSIFHLGMPVHENLRAICSEDGRLLRQWWRWLVGVECFIHGNGAAQGWVVLINDALHFAAQRVDLLCMFRQQTLGLCHALLEQGLARQSRLPQLADLLLHLLKI